MKNRFVKFRFMVLLLITGLIFSCAKIGPEKEWKNPFDPQGTDYHPPKVFAKNDTVASAFVPLLLLAEGSDENGTISGFCWSFDGGGNWDTSMSADPYQKTWSPSEAGVNTVWFRAIDNDGLVSSPDSFNVEVHAYAPVLVPVADLPVSQSAEVTINFEATDTNGTITKYCWKSAAGEDGWSDSSEIPEAKFSNPEGGPLQIIWAAFDNDGVSTSDTFTIIFNRGPGSASLSELSDSFITFDFDDFTGSINLSFTAEDPDGEADTLVYTIFFGEKGSQLLQVYFGTDPVYLANNIVPATQYVWQLHVKDLFGDSIESSGEFTSPQPPAGPEGMKLIRSKNRTFSMGQNDFAVSEKPIHSVTFTYHFWMDSVEVTDDNFGTVLGLADGLVGSNPVADISWYDAALYCNARSKHFGHDTVYLYTGISGIPGSKCVMEGLSVDLDASGYRLPTEAEWEFACRAGMGTLFYWGNSRIDISGYAWVNTTSGGAVQNVALKTPNTFGLYDMSGNVWEWCNDWYDSSYYTVSPSENPSGPQSGQERVMRGGSWMHSDYFAQSGSRSKMQPQQGNVYVGFRSVLVVK